MSMVLVRLEVWRVYYLDNEKFTVNGVALPEAVERLLIVSGILNGKRVGEDIYVDMSEDTYDVELVSRRVLELAGGRGDMHGKVNRINELVRRDLERDVESVVPDECEHLILNFFRAKDYAFLFGRDMVNLDVLMGMQRESKCSEDDVAKLVEAMFEKLDYCVDKEMCLKDGVLRTMNNDVGFWIDCIHRAYKEYYHGPSWMKESDVRNLKAYTDLSNYMSMGSRVFKAIITSFAGMKMNPAVCQYTFLNVPDYVNTFNKLGIVMGRHAMFDTRYVLLLNGGAHGVVEPVILNVEDLEDILAAGMVSLAEYRYKGANGGERGRLS